jgi:hypothetical protein
MLGIVRTGLTKLINHFLINDSWYLVDLPGYGYVWVCFACLLSLFCFCCLAVSYEKNV